ncbi:MAG: hypothetical protein IMZ53_06495 [Thermoplasmata archaeon]|nr:hypothetical protein [Thermoplasmata archaeon]
MHKNTHRIDAHIPEELYCELREQPGGITQMVVDAVVQYNEMLPRLGHFERQDVKERLIKEAEEEAAKVFLEGILDIVQRGNS